MSYELQITGHNENDNTRPVLNGFDSGIGDFAV